VRGKGAERDKGEQKIGGKREKSEQTESKGMGQESSKSTFIGLLLPSKSSSFQGRDLHLHFKFNGRE